MMSEQSQSSRTEVVRTLHRAFNDRDREALLSCLADDVSWHVEGRHPLAGTYRGKDGLWDGYLDPMWQSPARYEERELHAHGDHVVALAEVVHNFGDGERGWKTVEIFRLTDGQVSERWAFTSGQEDLDRLFTRGCAADPGPSEGAVATDGEDAAPVTAP